MKFFELRFSDEEVLWFEMLESVPKDIECVNGILNGHFRLLKYPIQYDWFENVECVMMV